MTSIDEEPAAGAFARVLLVDADAEFRFLARLVLDEAGCDVDEAQGAADALEVLRGTERCYDVVLLGLAGAEGYEVALAAATLRPEASLIVAADAPPTNGLLHTFLRKPLVASELAEAVAAALDAGMARVARTTGSP